MSKQTPVETKDKTSQCVQQNKCPKPVIICGK